MALASQWLTSASPAQATFYLYYWP